MPTNCPQRGVITDGLPLFIGRRPLRACAVCRSGTLSGEDSRSGGIAMWVWLFGGLLLAHGVVHARWRTYAPRRSRLFTVAPSTTLSYLSAILFAAAAFGFGLAGLGAMAGALWWPGAAAASALISLTLLGIFWQNAFALAAVVNVVVLIGVLWLR